ncbi:hypothetical protein TcasGA2_TC010560 [Tribolium castaneum]|uniref:Uncharacterized protein n=1 Tax=Tribolium castaneum TaxID=7070 RepID=D7GYG2_TRICA|nr:hypothetical protein TcasGA2_TC010560 [Tribolium castaneum]
MKNGTLFKLDATTYWQLIVPTHEDEPRDELDKPETWPEKIIENEAELETSGKTEYEDVRQIWAHDETICLIAWPP